MTESWESILYLITILTFVRWQDQWQAGLAAGPSIAPEWGGGWPRREWSH